MSDLFIKGDASISKCGRYRWTLTRYWDRTMAKPWVGWIMLNPSTADGTEDDATIRKCIAFARAWGFGGMTVWNLFPLRATDPAEMLAAEDPIGMDDTAIWSRIQDVCPLLIAAWGNHGGHRGRDRQIVQRLKSQGMTLHCLGTNQDGSPKHPLYLPGSLKPVPFEMGVRS